MMPDGWKLIKARGTAVNYGPQLCSELKKNDKQINQRRDF
jgi:hypothetical protein